VAEKARMAGMGNPQKKGLGLNEVEFLIKCKIDSRPTDNCAMEMCFSFFQS